MRRLPSELEEPMTYTMTCKRCQIEMSGETEDAFVAAVQDHHARYHPEGHSPSREQVLARLQRNAAAAQ